MSLSTLHEQLRALRLGHFTSSITTATDATGYLL